MTTLWPLCIGLLLVAYILLYTLPGYQDSLDICPAAWWELTKGVAYHCLVLHSLSVAEQALCLACWLLAHYPDLSHWQGHMAPLGWLKTAFWQKSLAKRRATWCQKSVYLLSGSRWSDWYCGCPSNTGTSGTSIGESSHPLDKSISRSSRGRQVCKAKQAGSWRWHRGRHESGPTAVQVQPHSTQRRRAKQVRWWWAGSARSTGCQKIQVTTDRDKQGARSSQKVKPASQGLSQVQWQ